MYRPDNIVRDKILNLRKGSIFFPSDFDEVATPEAIRQTLSRMVKQGEILRVSRGVYCTPKSNKALGLDVIPPSAEEIAQRIAERDRIKIIPTGDYALNRLGLSTQVPVNAVYITNGARKKIKLANGSSIIFRESNEFRLFEFSSGVMMLVVSAMRSIGENNITTETIAKIKEILASVPDDLFKNDIRLAPVWVRKKLEE